MTIIFFGNTKYSKLGLKIVQPIYPISLIITIPNSPVFSMAKQLNIDLIETNKLDQITIDKIAKYKPDFLIVEDYGLILPKNLLTLPKYAPLNMHHSLLPKYRGPSPVPSTILAGDKISGVTIIKMSEEVDSGDILAQQEYELTPKETTDTLLTKLNELGGQLLLKVIKQYLEGSINPIPQDHSQATYTKHFNRENGYFDINNPPDPQKLDRKIRAYHPWPGVWTKWKGKIVKFLPGGLLQMEGKKPIPFKDFLNGYPDFPISKATYSLQGSARKFLHQ